MGLFHPLRSQDSRIRIRPARPADAAALSAAAIRIWQTVYDGVLPRHALLGLRPERWATRFSKPASDRACIYLAEHREAGIVGYGVCGPTVTRDTVGARGEVFELYVAPAFQGWDVGRGFMTAMAGFLQLRDLEPVDVWVLEKNPTAAGFYEHLGGIRCARGSTVFGGVPYAILGYRFDDLDRLMGLAWIGSNGRASVAGRRG